MDEYDYYRETQVSPECIAEIIDEIENGSRDTPERRATFEGAKIAGEIARRSRERHGFPKDW